MFHTLTVFLAVVIVAERMTGENPPPSEGPRVTLEKLFIEPSSSRLLGGKAHLLAGTLHREGKTLVGNYQIRVTPYFFKSETGKLLISLSQPSLQAFRRGMPAEFRGVARTNGTNQSRAVVAHANPSTDKTGALSISVATENGTLRFQTTYRTTN